MKQALITLVVYILLTGCGESDTPIVQKNSGMFSGTLAEKEYEVSVNCFNFDEDITFLSDKTDTTDTNGDGIIISGMEYNGKFVLTIVDNGRTFSTGNLSNFTKGDKQAEGSGILYEDGAANKDDVQFTVICE